MIIQVTLGFLQPQHKAAVRPLPSTHTHKWTRTLSDEERELEGLVMHLAKQVSDMR